MTPTHYLYQTPININVTRTVEHDASGKMGFDYEDGVCFSSISKCLYRTLMIECNIVCSSSLSTTWITRYSLLFLFFRASFMVCFYTGQPRQKIHRVDHPHCDDRSFPCFYVSMLIFRERGSAYEVFTIWPLIVMLHFVLSRRSIISREDWNEALVNANG